MWNPLQNQVLISALLAWAIASVLKIPIEYRETHKINWGLPFSTGGMPSSHSALVVGMALSTGLYVGFASPLFAIAFVLMMVVTYDATGVRRQAGIHAEKINMLIEELFSGQPISEDELKEVLGHTPLEVIAGAGIGVVTSLVIWLVWH